MGSAALSGKVVRYYLGLPRESTEFVSSESSSETEILSSSIFKYTALRFQRVRVLKRLKALERKAIAGHCLLQAALYRTVPYHCRVRYGTVLPSGFPKNIRYGTDAAN